MEEGKQSKKQKLAPITSREIKVVVALTNKSFSGITDVGTSLIDGFDELQGRKVKLQLIGTYTDTVTSSKESNRRNLAKKAYLEHWITGGDTTHTVRFEWTEEMGIPWAFTITNLHHTEFYLKTLTLEDVPGHGRIHFICNSWVYPAEHYHKDRVFFANKTYLPSQTPGPLLRYREEELDSLRGNGSGKMEEWDRIYDYDVYNDLGDPDKGAEHVRPILGGSTEYPYPRRGRTGRPPATSDPKSESRLALYETLSIYIPRDERFSQIKMSNVVRYSSSSHLSLRPCSTTELLY